MNSHRYDCDNHHWKREQEREEEWGNVCVRVCDHWEQQYSSRAAADSTQRMTCSLVILLCTCVCVCVCVRECMYVYARVRVCSLRAVMLGAAEQKKRKVLRCVESLLRAVLCWVSNVWGALPNERVWNHICADETYMSSYRQLQCKSSHFIRMISPAMPKSQIQVQQIVTPVPSNECPLVNRLIRVTFRAKTLHCHALREKIARLSHTHSFSLRHNAFASFLTWCIQMEASMASVLFPIAFTSTFLSNRSSSRRMRRIITIRWHFYISRRLLSVGWDRVWCQWRGRSL